MSVLFESPETVVPLLAMLALLAGSGFFSSSETALFFLSHDQVRAFQNSKRSSERRVFGLLLDPDRLLTAVLFWNLVINLAYFACGIFVSQRLFELGHSAWAGAFGVGSLSLMIVCGEVLPKSSAVMYREPLARTVSLPLAFAVRVFDPAAPLFKTVTRSLRMMFWPSIQRERYLDPKDLEQAIDNSEGNQAVIQQERLLLHNILDLSEIPVEEVMRPRGTYQAVRAPVHLDALRGRSFTSDYVIVVDANGDDVVGTISLKRFTTVPQKHLEKAAEPIVHVPWCATVAFALHKLESDACSVASVVNEYGETIGIVTYEDIVDTILEFEPSRARRLLRRDPVVPQEDGSWAVDGITSLRYLSRQLQIEYVPDADNQVTIAGVFHEALERIPDVGDECDWNGFRMRVVKTSDRGHFRAEIRPIK